ncbi:MAG: metalloregulator ArsR/SmtB family transcription factor [Chrysiogenia bacterium]
MIKTVRILRVLADENRLRLLLLLQQRELFVCQLMAVLQLSQPLVSRNLALLEREGLLDSRRQGKHVFYRLKKNLPPLAVSLLRSLAKEPAGDDLFARDRQNMELFCRRFLRGAECDMGAIKSFIEYKNKKNKQGANYGKIGQKNVH